MSHLRLTEWSTRTQWPFQEPKLEVPTIYKAYFSGLNFREYPQKIWPNIWYSQYLHFRMLKFPLMKYFLGHLTMENMVVSIVMVVLQ